MKKGIMLNADIVEVIARMGHMDEIVIGDAGLPIPEGVRRIDLALKAGTPNFMETLETLMSEFVCEGATLAKEIQTINPVIELEIKSLLQDIPITYVDHEDFKKQTEKAKAFIRTGECSPYANIILRSGVFF